MAYSLIPLTAATGYGVMIVLLANMRIKGRQMDSYLMSFFVFAAVVSVLHAVLYLTPGNFWVRHIATYVWAASLICLLAATSQYTKQVLRRRTRLLVLIWLAMLLALDWLFQDSIVVKPAIDRTMNFPQLDLGGIFYLSSWLIGSMGMVIHTLVLSARTELPLHSNRLLYWAAVLLFVFCGQFLSAIQDTIFSTPGYLMQLTGSGGLLFGVVSYHLVDIRRLGRIVLGFFLSTLLVAVIILFAILAAQTLQADYLDSNPLATMVGVGLAFAVFFQLIHGRVDRFINRFIIQQNSDLTVIVETYSRKVGNILDIDELSTAAIDTIHNFFGIKRGGLMLVTDEQNKVVVQPTGNLTPNMPMSFNVDGPVFAYFKDDCQPLSQYDIDVLPKFSKLDEEQRQWLAGFQMDLFVPIVTDGLPIGILAIGSKNSGEPFRSSELQTLQTLAGQTVGALTNARLFDDMRRLNAEIRSLNEDLRYSNERLQYMDQVKTDFITIASHELRTPLTQIRGYADILDAINEGGMLTTEETDRLLNNIIGAAGQLETVISAMLDVSQIDVDAMSLNLAETSMDAVFRMSIQPLVNAMKDRKLNLTVHGIRNLPNITADFSRLVQAVSNLISNAVKYTPDGGRITITAKVLENEKGEQERIEIIIADTGVGVDLRDQELIFEKFFRAADPKLHSSGDTKFMGAGPGLGLSIVRGIVDAHRGRIWVESEGYDPVNYPGSQFHMVLPIHQIRSGVIIKN
ncbi:MAG: GAF domain-containing sensor histidine kinase [Anaerolineales bacterium]|nr:GAF domain-containing sensor histidine kinase [Anaerolineales bacterium]